MKNKHLVLLFLVTLGIGLAIRRAPWREATFFQTSLLRLDTAAVQQVQIILPGGKSSLFLLRGDAGWSAEQADRSVKVSPQYARQMLAALADLKSVRIVKTNRPDTLGFGAESAIQLSIVQSKGQAETLRLGLEISENGQPSTFVQLPKHEGIYLVDKHLREIFFKSLTDFRNQTIVQFAPGSVRSFAIFGQGKDSLLVHKNDSTGFWEGTMPSQIYPDAQVQSWLTKVAGLKSLAFADLYDESHADETLYAQIKLEFAANSEPLNVAIFRFQLMNVPEEMPEHGTIRHQFAPFVLHSSQNPTNYFMLSDTGLLRQICQPF